MRTNEETALCLMVILLISCLIVVCMFAPRRRKRNTSKQYIPTIARQAGNLPGPDSYVYVDNGTERRAVRGTEMYNMISKALHRSYK